MIKKIILCFSLITIMNSSFAAVSLDRTRVILNEHDKEKTIKVTNHQAIPYLIQSWLTNEKGDKISEPLTVVPPLQRVEANSYTIIRTVKVNSHQLALDRENLFYLHVREIPPKEKNSQDNTLQLALESQIKVFYRPEILAHFKQAPITKLVIEKEKTNSIKLLNQSAFYITITNMKYGINNELVKQFKPIMLPPFSEQKLNIDHHTNYQITTINDHGAVVDNNFICQNNVCHYFSK